MWGKYTVVLLRPDYDPEDGEEPDVYVAMVEALSPKDAVLAGQLEVHEADKNDGIPIERPDQYQLVVLMSGWQVPVLYGWQL